LLLVKVLSSRGCPLPRPVSHWIRRCVKPCCSQQQLAVELRFGGKRVPRRNARLFLELVASHLQQLSQRLLAGRKRCRARLHACECRPTSRVSILPAWHLSLLLLWLVILLLLLPVLLLLWQEKVLLPLKVTIGLLCWPLPRELLLPAACRVGTEQLPTLMLL
jgi:hypothetical protein